MTKPDAISDTETNDRDDREAPRRAVAEARAAAECGELVDHEVVAAWLDDLARGIRRPAPKLR